MWLKFIVVLILPLLAAGNARAEMDAATLWKKKCQTCHGVDGAGSVVMARSLDVQEASLDITRDEIREKSDEEIIKIIRDGRWKMPGFSNQLTRKKETKILDYFRQLQTPKPQ